MVVVVTLADVVEAGTEVVPTDVVLVLVGGTDVVLVAPATVAIGDSVVSPAEEQEVMAMIDADNARRSVPQRRLRCAFPSDVVTTTNLSPLGSAVGDPAAQRFSRRFDAILNGASRPGRRQVRT